MDNSPLLQALVSGQGVVLIIYPSNDDLYLVFFFQWTGVVFGIMENIVLSLYISSPLLVLVILILRFKTTVTYHAA